MDLTTTLKLVIEKGPREGQTLEFNSNPGSTVRIGRVLRGNTFAIKDNGISSKHLAIEWCSESKWIVKDLDSSNGTFLNSFALHPFTVHDLRDGDVLKIGEVTSIRVQISHVSDSQPLGRNLRSRARVLDTVNTNDAEKGNRRGRGRGRDKGDPDLETEIPDSVDLEVNKKVNVPEEDNEKERGRGRGRGRCRGKVDAKLGGEGLNSEVNMEAIVPDAGVRRGRSQAKGKTVLQKPEVNPEISDNVEDITDKGGPVSKRRTRSSKKENDKIETMGDSSQTTGISLGRMTRGTGMKNIDNSALERIPEATQLENAAHAEKATRRGRKKNEVEMDSAQHVTAEYKVTQEEGNEQESLKELEIAEIKPEPQSNIEGILSKGEHPSKESMNEVAENGGDVVCELSFEHEGREEMEATTSNQDDTRAPESPVAVASDKDDGAEIPPDMNKMTLGEWLDYLEWLLPKQIRAETEQVIEDIQKRSQQFHDFLLQQEKDKMSTAS